MKDFKKMMETVVKVISECVEYDWFRPENSNRQTINTGTAFFINDKGYLLTCAHVVDGAVRISFTVPSEGKKKIEAELVAINFEKDLALLKSIDYQNKSFASLGNSNTLIPGQNLKIIGYPLGMDRLKVSSGIYSGNQGNLLQTDAPMNPGNSGGCVVDENKNVIGVCVSKITTNNADNIGYAVPINDFKSMSEDMFKREHTKDVVVKSPDLGIFFNNSNDFFMEYLQSTGQCKSGYYVKNILENSSFYKAGVGKGDVLCSFDNLKLDNHGEISVPWSHEKVGFLDIIEKYNFGSEVNIKFWDHKSGKIKSEDIKLDSTDLFSVKIKYPPYEQIDYEIFGGCTVMPLAVNHLIEMETSDVGIPMKTSLYLKSFIKPENRVNPVLIITSIFPGSYIKSLENTYPGDLIETVNGIPVRTIDEYRKALLKPKKVSNKYFIVIVSKNNNTTVLPLEIILKQEPFLLETFGYKPSETFKNIIFSVSQSKKYIIKK